MKKQTMSKSTLDIGDVVQIHPDVKTWGAAFMVVTEPKKWGAVGYFTIPGKDGVAWYRARKEDMKKIGVADYVIKRSGRTEHDG